MIPSYSSVAFATLLIVLDLVICQKIPLRSSDPSQLYLSDAELLLGTKMLPDGVEVVSYLNKHIPSRYYFMIEDEKTPLEIVVTPCNCAIELKIFLQSLPLEGSAVGSDDYDDDLFQQYNGLGRHASTSEAIQSHNGTGVVKYRSESALIGIYVIDLLTVDRHCSVRMSASTSPFSDLIYPELPRDARVTSRFLGRGTVALSWKPSPSAWRHYQPIEYCVSVNRNGHFPTHCTVRAFKYGDQPPTAPPDAGFRFAWRHFSDKMKTEAKEMPESSSSSRPEEELLYKCVDGNTRTVLDIAPSNGQTYYFDVFAVNRKTNASSAYTGSRIVAKDEGKMIKLKDGKLLSVHMKRSVPERFFSYQLSRKSTELNVFVQPCSGLLNVSVDLERGKKIRSLGNVALLESIRISNAKPGQYLVKVSKVMRPPRSASFRIFASADVSLVPYPTLPKDARLKTFDKLNTCTSVTLAWMRTPKRQKYCLYSHVSLENQTYSEQDRCLGPQDRPKTEKLLCRHFRAANDRRSVMTETVRKLKPQTTYVFTVYAVKQGGVSLPFEHLTIRTKDTC